MRSFWAVPLIDRWPMFVVAITFGLVILSERARRLRLQTDRESLSEMYAKLMTEVHQLRKEVQQLFVRCVDLDKLRVRCVAQFGEEIIESLSRGESLSGRQMNSLARGLVAESMTRVSGD